MLTHRPILAGLALSVAFALAASFGCSRQHYRESADRQVYAIIQAKSSRVPGMLKDFSIETPPGAIERHDMPPTADEPAGADEEAGGTFGGTAHETAEVENAAAAAAGDAGQAEGNTSQGPMVISLARALELAALNNREYQTQKETLYLSALTLTLRRHSFAPNPFGTITGKYDNVDNGDTESVSAETSFGTSWLFKTGTRVTATLTSYFTRLLYGARTRSASSLFNIAISQPLLQGAGISVTESLTQAERDVIYAMRTFVRYRRTFFVSVLSQYYNVLRNRQILQNELLNKKNLTLARERAELMGKAGRLAEFQVDQVRQQELSADARVQAQQQRYQNALDQFKLTLGLPTEIDLELDPAELQRLTAEGQTTLPLELDRAIELALKQRLDLITSYDRLEDARRKVEVAANDLLPGLDLSASLSVGTDDSKPLHFDTTTTDTSVGLELDLPLDKVAERNEYRRRLIEYQRAKRNYEQLRDQVVQQVRNDWREYVRARTTYEINKTSLALAQRRVDSTTMLLRAGRVDARDLLDAQSSLLSAQNNVATALVDFRVARLALARDLGILQVDERGQLKESFDEYK